jgi:SAM-dependent methyltransferase
MAEMNPPSATPHSYFRDMYDGSPDPWGFDDRWYEQRKFAITTACLPRARYRRGLEPGCSNGALTEHLAPRCHELIAFDFVDEAVQRCRTRMAPYGGVEVVSESFPDFWPPGRGDLVVWSEVAYYLAAEQSDDALAGLERWLEEGGNLVAVHYTGDTNYPRHGADIGPWLDGVDFLERRCRHVDDRFELGVWERLAAPRRGTDV